MKRSFFLIWISLATLGFSQEPVIVDTVYGQQELIVPEDYETLKEYYIEISTMYLEKRKDLEDVLDLYTELNLMYQEINKIDEDLIELAKRSSMYKQFLQFTIEGDTTTSSSFGVEYSGLIFDRFIFSLGVQYPTSFNLGLGLKL